MTARQFFSGVLGGAVLGTFLLVCAGANAEEPKRGGSITVGLETDLRGFDPIKARGNIESVNYALGLILDGKAQKFIVENPTADDLKRYGLASPKVRLTLAEAGRAVPLAISSAVPVSAAAGLCG